MRTLRCVFLAGFAHLVVAFFIGAIAFGWDFDQLRSRSASSRAAAVVNDVLWFPHDAFMRAVPNGWMIANARAVIPGAIVANSLLWGIAICVALRLVRRVRHGNRGRAPATMGGDDDHG